MILDPWFKVVSLMPWSSMHLDAPSSRWIMWWERIWRSEWAAQLRRHFSCFLRIPSSFPSFACWSPSACCYASSSLLFLLAKALQRQTKTVRIQTPISKQRNIIEQQKNLNSLVTYCTYIFQFKLCK